MNCTGACCLSDAKKKHRWIPRVFEYENAPHVWSDEGKVKCLGQTRPGKVCRSNFSILLPDHLQQEVVKLVGLIAFLMNRLVVIEDYAFSMILNSRPCIAFMPNLRVELRNLYATKMAPKSWRLPQPRRGRRYPENDRNNVNGQKIGIWQIQDRIGWLE